MSTLHGQRNRTMMEVLYACGLRVSELINLKITDIYFDIELIKVIGKGNKERLIPMSWELAGSIKAYITISNSYFSIEKTRNSSLFLLVTASVVSQDRSNLGITP